MKKVKILPIYLSFLILIYIISVMTVNLSSFPGLHGDEAWFGLNAREILHHGTRSLHGLNTYTSSFYSWLISLTFRLLGIKVFSLRLLGVFLNLLGFIIVVYSLNKYVDQKTSILFLFLLLSCSSLLLFPRIAWEVCALQVFFLSLKFNLLLKYFKNHEFTFLDIFLFLFITSLGVINHFIFIFESLALTVAALILHLRYFNKTTIQLFYFSFLSLIVVSIIYVTKPLISDEIFQAYRYILLIISLAVLALVSTIFIKTQQKISQFLSLPPRFKQIFYWLAGVFLLLLSLFLLRNFLTIHSQSFLGTISGIIVIERLSSTLLTVLEKQWLEITWIALISIFILRGLQKLINNNSTNNLQTEVFFYLYPLFCLLFVSLAPGNFDRYYIIPGYLFLIAFPLVVRSQYITAQVRHLYLSLIILLGFTFTLQQTLLWRNILATENQSPRLIRYGNFQDLSYHFLKHDQLLKFLQEKQICRINQIDRNTVYFIYAPLDFHFLERQLSCDNLTTVLIEYCPHCRDFPKDFKIIETNH